MRATVVVLVLASPSFASGFSFEGGAGAGFLYPAVETAITGHVTLGTSGSFEVRTRGVLGLNFAGVRPDFSITTTLGYRTSTPTSKTVSGNFGFGVGGVAALGCGGGDYCGGFGPLLELSPRLVLSPGRLAQTYLGLNLAGAYLFRGNVRFFASAGIVIGCTFEFAGQPRREPKPVRFDTVVDDAT